VARLTLNDLLPNECAVVRGYTGDGPAFPRLCEMGFVPGSMLRLVRFAPFGDPIAVEIHGFHVSLRRVEAAFIEVERIAAPVPTCGVV
jgi:ferrous iron transport protein A